MIGDTIIGILVGLIFFLYGIENFSKEIQHSAGTTLRKLILKLTKNRISGTLTGFGSTVLIQSSTATIVIAVSLVDAGIISFVQSIPIIFGANIGTTITAQLIALNFLNLAPFFVIVGFAISLFSKKFRIVGKGIFYFGLVFFGLYIISTTIEPIKNNPILLSYMAKLSNVFIALLVGFIFTAIVQSSAVTTGVVIILAGSGMISLGQGIPLLLGANIGTTVTTLIVSFKLNIHAKKAAIAHLLFNLAGAIIFLPIIIPFANIVASLGGSTAHQIANAHTIFNVIVALIFLIFLIPFSKLIDKIVKKDSEEEILLRPKFLKEKLPSSTKEAFNLIKKEIKYSFEITSKTFKKSFKLLNVRSEKEANNVKKLESLNDLLDQEIEFALLELSKRKLSLKEANDAINMIKLSNFLEQLGDLADDLGNIQRKMTDRGISIPKDSKIGIGKVYVNFMIALEEMKEKFPKPLSDKRIRILSMNSTKAIIKEYDEHVKRALRRKNNSGSIFVEAASIMENSFTKLVEINDVIKNLNRR